jgi:serine protease Do
MRSVVVRRLVVLFVVALVAAACSSGGSEETTTVADAGGATTTVAAVTTTVGATTTTADEGPGAVEGLKAVRGAVVRIVAEGSFVDPAEGLVSNAAGSGSGFVIDPSGLAVTNNHVVTGAAFLQVYVEGEDEPRNAKILGVSECSDLAVIDIDGADFPYLAWDEGDLATGTKVYAAGFPLGDPEYTLTEGIISKEKASGEDSWASIDSVIEHTAQILPGNSGGPLVTEDGRVIGVNYASVNDLDLNYAISRVEVDKILGDLIAGENVNSIGVNGEAFATDDLSGIWVASVASGSPAANLGITGGDVITKMEGIVLASDGTMSEYCDILRSHNNGDPLSVEVLRFDTQEVLKGTLNGDEELQQALSFADELADDVADTGTADDVADAAYEYMEVRDSDGILVMEIPTTWTDVYNEGWYENDVWLGNALVAAPDLDAVATGWDMPGVAFSISEALAGPSPDEWLDQDNQKYNYSNDCVYDDRYDYDDGVYKGQYDLWTNCGGTATVFIDLEAYPADGSFLVLVQVQVVDEADLEALDHILDTFDTNLG